MDKNKTNQFGYRLGCILATIVALCLAAVVIGLTVRFLFWLF